MMEDIMGIRTLNMTAKSVVEKMCNGLGNFLDAVFKPGLQELGYLIKDLVRTWRLQNILRVMDKAKGRLGFENNELQLQANARVGLSIIEESPVVDDDELQNLWAGLFASSCTRDGKDDSNIIFVDLLKRMSVVEARILKYSCENCKKVIFPNGLIVASPLSVSLDDLKRLTGINDVYRLDRELDHMVSLSLLGSDIWNVGGFSAHDENLVAEITPSALALNLFYKTNALNVSPKEFWEDTLEEIKSQEKQ